LNEKGGDQPQEGEAGRGGGGVCAAGVGGGGLDDVVEVVVEPDGLEVADVLARVQL
jgi:hypothetical protein